MDDKWIGVLAGGAVLLAFITNPTLAQHQQQVKTILSQAKDNAISSFSAQGYFALSAIDVIRDGSYDGYLVASRYKVKVGGSPFLECFGIFGQVFCGASK